MDFAKSYGWRSWEKQATEKWFGLDPRLQRMYPADRHISKRCPYVPRSLQEYIEHRLEFQELQFRRQERLLQTYLEEQKARKGHDRFTVTSIGGVPLPYPPRSWTLPFFGLTPFGYRSFHNVTPGIFDPAIFHPLIHDSPSRSAVLAQHTIWHYGDPDNHRLMSTRGWVSPWPCAAELSHEGNERVNTENGRFGRCVPLARIPTHASISWTITPRASEFPFDALYAKIPNEEDIYYPVDEIEEEKVGDLLDQNLLDALDIKIDEFEPPSYYHGMPNFTAELSSIYSNGISVFLRHSLSPHDSVYKARSTYLDTLRPRLVPFPGPSPARDLTTYEIQLMRHLAEWYPPTVHLPLREASPEPVYIPQPVPLPEPVWIPEPAPVAIRLPPLEPIRQVEPVLSTPRITNSSINPLAPAFLPSPTSRKSTLQPHAPCFTSTASQYPQYSPPPTPRKRVPADACDDLNRDPLPDFGPIGPPKKKDSRPMTTRPCESEPNQPIPHRPPEIVTAVKSWLRQIDDRAGETVDDLASLVNALAFDGHW